jgi:hypothetical protein
LAAVILSSHYASVGCQPDARSRGATDDKDLAMLSNSFNVSSTRVRSSSAPPRLTVDSHKPAPTVAQARAAWNDALHAASPGLDDDLIQVLSLHAESDADTLDLRKFHEAFQHRPSADSPSSGKAKDLPALSALMEALAGLRNAKGQPTRTLLLPPGLSRLPGLSRDHAWLKHFKGVTQLIVPHFRGKGMDARVLSKLKLLDLGTIPPRDMTLRLPLGCEWHAEHADGGKVKHLSRAERGYQQVELAYRPLNFNCMIAKPGGGVYVCRNLSTEKLRWDAAQLFRAPMMEPVGNPFGDKASLAKIITPDVEAIAIGLSEMPKECYPVASGQWKDFVEHYFAQMARDGQTIAFALMETPSHVMRLIFDATNPANPVVDCWDPNFSDVNTVSHAPFEFRALFWDMARVLEPYFDKCNAAFNDAPHVRVIPVRHPLDPRLDIAVKASKRIVHLEFADLAHHPHPGTVKDMVAFAFEAPGLQEGLVEYFERASKPLDREACISLLTAWDEHGNSALHRAACKGHGQSFLMLVPALVAAVRHKHLTQDDVADIVSARGPMGTSMAYAFQMGRASVVKGMGNAVIELWRKGALSDRHVYHLLRATSDSGSSSIHTIDSKSVAKALKHTLQKAYKAGALSKEHFVELKNELKQLQRQ